MTAVAVSATLRMAAAHVDLYNPQTGVVDHTIPNKRHADALRQVHTLNPKLSALQPKP
jgi:hypothetical protein